LANHRPNAEPALAHHFANLTQQREAAEMGMWLFLATEIMFFGGLFLAYFVYRSWYPRQFVEGGETMNLTLGTINTAVLLTSSLSMALAVQAAEQSRRGALIARLAVTIVLGTVFLGIKMTEYHHKYAEHLIPFGRFEFRYPGSEHAGLMTFINLYFLMTGLHAAHMIIGIGILLTLIWMAWRGGLLAERAIVVHNVGLYWHFVDLIWVFLFPFFYLVAVHVPH
jgi:cytochrome c oxidase subunit 3